MKRTKAASEYFLTSFCNTRIKSFEAYTSVTTSTLTVTWRERDKIQMENIDLKSISKISRPQVNQVYLEYSRSGRERRAEKKSLLLEVTDEGGHLKETIEELFSIIQL